MTTDRKNTKTTGGMPSEAPTALSGTTKAAGDKPSKQKRWQETRGLLQQALAEWEKSEQKATEMLKEAESEREHLEDLLLKLKAKLEELS
ncbi:MAG: hypothetical protein KF767_17110 [Bdellovibrionaceae bacterium]|nr:hypothetical protein [Pseudobdellovibrionaceae bacterium]